MKLLENFKPTTNNFSIKTGSNFFFIKNKIKEITRSQYFHEKGDIPPKQPNNFHEIFMKLLKISKNPEKNCQPKIQPIEKNSPNSIKNTFKFLHKPPIIFQPYSLKFPWYSWKFQGPIPPKILSQNVQTLTNKYPKLPQKYLLFS